MMLRCCRNNAFTSVPLDDEEAGHDLSQGRVSVGAGAPCRFFCAVVCCVSSAAAGRLLSVAYGKTLLSIRLIAGYRMITTAKNRPPTSNAFLRFLGKMMTIISIAGTIKMAKYFNSSVFMRFPGVLT